MKSIYTFMVFILFAQMVIAQAPTSRKGDFYGYWGWNRGWYSKSDLHFKGNDYDFTLKKVVAKDRQSPFAFNPYFHPAWLTIPQYNFRVGYFISNHYNISFGADHMKYVMQANQTVKINGQINTGSTFDGTYQNQDIKLVSNFLQFEHTDGLNYGNIELRRFDELFLYRKFVLSVTEGFGWGVLYPRTNTTLLNKERYDQFHVAGFGLAAVAGLNAQFFTYFYLQSEMKLGYINMPNIRTTKNTDDLAKQQFGFVQANIVLGYRINLKRI